MPRSFQSTMVVDLRYVSASSDDPLAQLLLSELEAAVVARGYRRVYLITGYRQPEAKAPYHASGYICLNERLPSRGSFQPCAFAKMLDKALP